MPRTVPTWPRRCYRIWDTANGLFPARATASTSTSASAAQHAVHRDRRRRDPAPDPTRRSAASTAPAAGSSSASSTCRRTRADRRRGRALLTAPRVPGGDDDADPRQRADGAADPRVGRARDRARPHPRLGGRVRRHLVARPGAAGLAAVRVRADEHHRRPNAPRSTWQLRLRRRGHPGPARDTSRTASGSGR